MNDLNLQSLELLNKRIEELTNVIFKLYNICEALAYKTWVVCPKSPSPKGAVDEIKKELYSLGIDVSQNNHN